jgi:hypothetical protein
MSIPVVCPGCKASFQVSEKFAGKQGPCPKCKTQITIPALESQVKIHAPQEFATGGKTKEGKPALKPIARKETRLQPVPTTIAVGGTIAVLVVAAMARGALAENSTLMLWLRAIGLLAVSAPIAAGGYALLRDDELEPHRGRWLWLRAALCGAVYTALWCGYYFIPADLTQDSWSWFFIAPPFLLIGAGTALVCFDLSFGAGFFHYCFYLLATLAVGWVAGLEMPWQRIVS